MLYESIFSEKNYSMFEKSPYVKYDFIIKSSMKLHDQEEFIHLIHDIIHNDHNITSLYCSLEILSEKYGHNNLKDYLNNLMKDTKYSNNKVLPIKKCIYQTKNYTALQSNNKFFSNKLKVMRILQSYGVSMIILHNDELTMLYDNDIIDDQIMAYIVQKTNLILSD